MRKAGIAILLFAALGIAGVFAAFRSDPAPAPDAAALNDALMTAANGGDITELSERLKLIYDGMDTARRARDRNVAAILCGLIALCAAAGIGLCLYCDRRILKPFRKLRRFAQNVAAGQLDIPLEMDRHGSFGAFTESFDLMREELERARENERLANKSKKELVASLSHDIKTPVASIRAVTELMLAKSSENTAQLGIILAKADQIDLLVTNLFQATLEELEQLKVAPADMPSTDLYELLQSADYDRKASVAPIPECLVTADKMRLQQVLDNVFSNSYKYAGTPIEVTARFEGRCLAVEIADTGLGVAPGELLKVFDKFYRGENASGKDGSGLGLYISRHLMKKMGGDIECVPKTGGFAVKILLPM